MKKTFIAILIGLFLVSVSGNVWAGNVVAADLICTNPAGCVQTDEIIDGAVTEPKLATGAVTNGKIADAAVTNSKIATGAVTTTSIAYGAVTTANISNGAVTDTQISGPISGAKLGTHTHNGSDITDGTISTAKISDDAVTTAKITDGSISTSKLADWSVNGDKIVDYSVTDTKINSNAVTTAKVADGAVTDAKISGMISGSKLGAHTHNGSDISDGTVTASKISDGAITDSKIIGPISANKVEKPANVLVVAKSGGDYTSIWAALASLPDPNTTPTVIKVMPGTYVESITMKSNVGIEGVSRDLVTIVPGMCYSCSGILFNGISNAHLSGVTISSRNTYDDNYVIVDIAYNSSSVTIKDCTIYGNAYYQSRPWIAIRSDSPSVTIKNNIITGGNSIGITVVDGEIAHNYIYGNQRAIASNGGSARIINNVITGNTEDGMTFNGSPTISGNIITGNGLWGLAVSNGTPLITNNTITGHQTDIILTGGTVNFNTINTISCGPVVKGKYNITTEGNDVIVP